MSRNLNISAEWETLDVGAPEEKACFAQLGIETRGVWLTEGRDALANRLRKTPLLSAYQLAEWMAWNWWRLRWEPQRADTSDWAYAHHLTTIGGGYIWPNITFYSDGELIALVAKPTAERAETPFRYIADHTSVVRGSEFEAEVDRFIDQVLQRLDSERVADTNLATIWNGVMEERRTPALAKARKLEALLGKDPDESDSVTVTHLIADAERLGIAAVEEIAAGHAQGGAVLTADELNEIATRKGFDATPRDIVRLTSGAGLPRAGQVPAWHLGSTAAKALRAQQRLNGEPISNPQLAQMTATPTEILSDLRGGPSISFALDDSPQHGRVVLRSKWETGRRFELARLLGDRIASPRVGKLFPATRAYTYRQQVQRSFAAEFLSPFEVVDDMLSGDFSTEKQLEVAEHFKVSELTVQTLLVNHGRLEREVMGEFGEAS